METHDFYRQYANLPLGKRMIPLGAPENGFLQRNMDDIYRRMKKLDDTMRPLRIEQRELLDVAEEGFKNLTTPL